MSEVLESKEVLVAAVVLGVRIIKKLQKHESLLSLLSDEELKALISKAVDGSSKLPEEMKDIDLQGGLELAAALIPALVAELKA
jgi:hypothetical protein